MNIKLALGTGVAALSLVFLSGCSDSDSNSSSGVSSQTYEVTMTNLSSNQPLSPLAVVLHNESYNGWSIGSAAGDGLETLAEGGDNTGFLADATLAGVLATASASGAIGPGNVISVEVEVNTLENTASGELQLTVASMLVNTNDAFTGSSELDLSSLELGDELLVRLPVYDAGTEGNNELAGTIPGPADGGEGFNSNRDDVNVVSRHPGVVSNVDGYADSVLDESHRFDSPIAQLVIRRVN